jgi:hypothetical protein
LNAKKDFVKTKRGQNGRGVITLFLTRPPNLVFRTSVLHSGSPNYFNQINM